MRIDWQSVQAIMEIVNLAAVVLLAAFTWISNRAKASAAAFNLVSDRLADHAARLDVIESDGKHSLSHADLGKIYDALNGLGREIAELRGSSESMRNTVQLINRKLMDDE